MSPRMPRLIVFDLDYTLWPLWIDTHISPPLKPIAPAPSTTELVDRSGSKLAFYRDVPKILQDLRHAKVKVGIASRTSAPALARTALRLLHIDAKVANLFFDPDAIEIYPGSKLTHFRKLHEKTGIPYDEMVFFDDESRNREVSKLGVTFVLVPEGVNRSIFNRGLEDWRKGKAVETERP